MKFVYLQTGMTGYNDACLQALHDLGHDVLNVYPVHEQDNYAFETDSFGGYGETFTWKDAPDQAELDAAIDAFDPDVVVMVSWGRPEYRKVMKRLDPERVLRVLHSTNVWEGRLKQWLGRATHRVYIDPLYDAVFVPGERSETFARYLGFEGHQVIRGTNTADTRVFDRGDREIGELSSARSFLFTGRLMPYKGVDVLSEAYQLYRSRTTDPWDLHVVGLGDLGASLETIPGVVMHGFVSPTEVSDLMHSTTCLVLPSYIDFFGVVVHEAALSGQVLICSDGVGATPYLLQDGFNGWTMAKGHVEDLAQALQRVSELSPERLMAMSTGSRALASRYSPRQWAEHLVSETARRLPTATPAR